MADDLMGRVGYADGPRRSTLIYVRLFENALLSSAKSLFAHASRATAACLLLRDGSAPPDARWPSLLHELRMSAVKSGPECL